jgi:protein-disulfide isomerase
MIAANAQAIFEDGYSWVGGNPDGDVTIVEFMDYRCGYCRRAHPEVETLVEMDGNVRLIVKEFPILGEESMLASRFAISTKLVMGDEAYKTVHDALIGMRGEITPVSLERLAGELELDVTAVMEGMVDPEVDRIIGENRVLAQTLGISGTPTFILPGQMLRGYLPLDAMMSVVAEERGEG